MNWMLPSSSENMQWKPGGPFEDTDHTGSNLGPSLGSETKANTMQWKHPGSLTPKKVFAQTSAGNVMLTVFLDQHGIVLMYLLAKGITITGAYYASLTMLHCCGNFWRPSKRRDRRTWQAHQRWPPSARQCLRSQLTCCLYGSMLRRVLISTPSPLLKEPRNIGFPLVSNKEAIFEGEGFSR